VLATITESAAGAALFLALTGARNVLARKRRTDSAAAIGAELRSPHVLVGLYLIAGLAALLLRGRPELRHAAETAGEIAGIVAVLRLVEVLFFAALRARGQILPRIVRSLIVWAMTFVVSAVVLRVEYRINLSSFLATSALLSVVLGFALQETLGNLFSGLTLHAEQPFERGEYVSFGKWGGKVLDVGWRTTRLLTGDQDELLVPNSLISREVVVNHSRPMEQDCVEIVLTLDLDAAPARCKSVILDALSSCPLVLREPAPRVLLAGFCDNGANYRVRFHAESYPMEGVALDQVHEALWYALRRAAIDLPYPQHTLSFRERPAEAEERRRREHSAEAEDLLSHIDFIEALRPKDRKLLATHARLLDYGPGQPVVRQGDPGDTFYLVARGELAVRVRNGIGDVEVARLGRGGFFGEMSLLTGEPRTATVVAVVESALLAVDRDAFSRVFAHNPEAAQELASVIARRRKGLDGVRAEGAAVAAVADETTLLDLIRSMFGFKTRTTA
jgi:small-conductance mechanosensitive channel